MRKFQKVLLCCFLLIFMFCFGCSNSSNGGFVNNGDIETGETIKYNKTEQISNGGIYCVEYDYANTTKPNKVDSITNGGNYNGGNYN